MERPRLTREELERIRREHGDEPAVERLAAEVDHLRKEVTDVAANLEALLMAWRGQRSEEHTPEEVQQAMDALASRLHALQQGRDETDEDEEVKDAMEDVQDTFERGG